jgi:hypothetical protein
MIAILDDLIHRCSLRRPMCSSFGRAFGRGNVGDNMETGSDERRIHDELWLTSCCLCCPCESKKSKISQNFFRPRLEIIAIAIRTKPYTQAFLTRVRAIALPDCGKKKKKTHPSAPEGG